ncbi:NAD(P)H-hydrate dehydratase [Halosimplex aquaticum]|uniref:ADP-dependent (S)-NAD(P)H-hydrate dehydratase n=1 Tax=Halosimplex aquaticum TaxID=3026162 RepID=A0ABD5Y5Z8_9EURY|nr:NAD(P)H-hydrate dehydratase [Halosimplex aquaticum]
MEELLSKVDSGPDSEKGENGRLGIVGGSIEFAGPPALAGLAALRAGTDVAKVLTSEVAIEVVAGFSPNILTNRFTGDVLTADSVGKVASVAAWSDALVIGPGLETPHPDAIEAILERTDVPTVVDATAIEPALGAEFEGAVLTPDSAEVERIEDEHGSLDEFVRATGAVVVSKGAEDVIYGGDDRYVNDEGTAAMTVAGTGDTLAGVIGSLLGQGLGPVDAARLGPRIVGRAGELAADEYGTGMVATDVIERVPAAIESGG